MAALGIVLCLHLTSSEQEPATARVLGAAALPVLAPTLLFTFSRGALAAAVVGVVAYAVIARPRALLTGLLAAGPATALALVAAYRADLLASKEPTTAAATAQGHDVALVVAACILFAAGLRALLLWLDPRLVAVRLERDHQAPARGRRARLLALAGVAFVVAGTDLPDRLRDQQKRFTRSDVRADGRQPRPPDRPRDQPPRPLERVAGCVPRISRCGGRGRARSRCCGTATARPPATARRGTRSTWRRWASSDWWAWCCSAIALVALLAGVARRARGPNRPLYAAVLVAGLVWVLHAGIDWDWEITAVTLWLFALTGQAGASAPAWRPRARRTRARRSPAGRRCACVRSLAASAWRWPPHRPWWRSHRHA